MTNDKVVTSSVQFSWWFKGCSFFLQEDLYTHNFVKTTLFFLFTVTPSSTWNNRLRIGWDPGSPSPPTQVPQLASRATDREADFGGLSICHLGEL